MLVIFSPRCSINNDSTAH